MHTIELNARGEENLYNPFTVLSTPGAFSTWEAASIWIVRNPKLRRRKLLNEKLAKGLRIVVETR